MEEKNNYGKGILGGLAFGIIASIPWILIYIFAGLFIAYLGALIGLGVIYGYKLFINRIDKKMPIIVSVIILFIVVVNAMVVIPGLLLIQNGIPFSISNLILLYQIEGILPEFIKELLISILFAALGAFPYINSINLQLKNNNSSEDIKPIYNSTALLVEYMKTIKDYFVSNSATDSEHAIEIEKDFNDTALKILKKTKVVNEVNGLFYYDLEKGTTVEENYSKLASRSGRPSSKIWIIVGIVLIVIVVICSILS